MCYPDKHYSYNRTQSLIQGVGALASPVKHNYTQPPQREMLGNYSLETSAQKQTKLAKLTERIINKDTNSSPLSFLNVGHSVTGAFPVLLVCCQFHSAKIVSQSPICPSLLGNRFPCTHYPKGTELPNILYNAQIRASFNE